MITIPYLITVAPEMVGHDVGKGLGSWSIQVRVWCSANEDAFDYVTARKEVERVITTSGLELDPTEHLVKDPSPLLRTWEFTLSPRAILSSDPIAEAAEAFTKLCEASRPRKEGA